MRISRPFALVGPLLLGLGAAASGQFETPDRAASLLSLSRSAYLLEFPAVQEELGLTPEVIDRVKQIQADHSRAVQDAFQEAGRALKARQKAEQEGTPDDPNPPPISPEQIQETPEYSEANKKIASLGRSVDESLSKVLTRAQARRLRELYLRVKGPLVVAEPEISSRLNMSEEQLAEVRRLIERSRAARDETRRSGYAEAAARLSNDPQPGAAKTANGSASRTQAEYRKAMLAVNEKVDAMERDTVLQVGKLLTRKQRGRFDAMLGAPFDVSAISGPPPSFLQAAQKKAADAARKPAPKAGFAATEDK